MSNSHRSLLTSKRKMKSAKASTDEVREQDQFMPIANVIRIMRKILPPHAKISDEAKETIQECVSEFISFITEEANDRCQGEERKTVTAEDVLWSMRKLGFDDYVEPLARYLERYRMSEGQPSVRRSSGSSSGSALGFLPPNILPRPSPLPQHPSILPQHPLPLPQHPPTLHQHPPPLLQHPPSLFPHPHPHPSPPPLFTRQGFGMFDPFDPSQGFFRADASASTSGSAGPSNFIANFESGSGSGSAGPGNFIANFDPFGNNK